MVGVDGFESSKAALRWAIHQAKLTGAVVDAVTSWHIPPGSGLIPAADMPDYQDDARIVLTEAITEMCMIDTDVVVRPRVVEGRAGPVLVEAAEGADLLVVGNRGHGGLAEALLGSVGQYCVRHAPCPVVIMRGKPRSNAAWELTSRNSPITAIRAQRVGPARAGPAWTPGIRRRRRPDGGFRRPGSAAPGRAGPWPCRAGLRRSPRSPRPAAWSRNSPWSRPAACRANTSARSARVPTIDPMTEVPLSTVSKTGMLSVPEAGSATSTSRPPRRSPA